MIAVMNDEPLRPTKLNPNIPPQVEVVVQRAMDRDLKQRYPDMVSLRSDLEHLIGYFEFSRSGSSAQRLSRRAGNPTYGSQQFTVDALGPGSRSLGTHARERFGRRHWRGAAQVPALAAYPRGNRAFGATGARHIVDPLDPVGTLLHRRVWGNTARVVEVLNRVRDLFTRGPPDLRRRRAGCTSSTTR